MRCRRYAAPVVTSVTGDGSTAGGSVITITGTNFGVTTPVVSLGTAGQLTAAPCANVTRLSHSTATCVLPVGSGTNTTLYLSVPGLAPNDVAVLSGFR